MTSLANFDVPVEIGGPLIEFWRRRLLDSVANAGAQDRGQIVSVNVRHRRPNLLADGARRGLRLAERVRNGVLRSANILTK